MFRHPCVGSDWRRSADKFLSSESRPFPGVVNARRPDFMHRRNITFHQTDLVHVSRINPRFKLLATEPAATAHDIALMRDRFPNVPKEYLELVADASEIELARGNRYLRIWHPCGCLEMNDGYGISKRLPNGVPIGDDGGGRVILYFDGDK